MYQAEGKTRAQEWVGNMGNKSHEALDKYKVLTGYHFDSSLDLIFLFRDPHYVRFNLFCTYIRMLEKKKVRRTLLDFLGSQNFPNDDCRVNSQKFPVRKDFALESTIYYHHLDKLSPDLLKL